MADTKQTKKTTDTAGPKQIMGTAAVLVSKYTRYDPKNPANTPVAAFVYTEEKGGVLDPDSYYAREGYLCVGTAEVTISLFPERQVTENQITALRTERKAVQAQATARCAQIDREIQSLLALPA